MKPIPSAPHYFASADGDIWRNGSMRVPNFNGKGYLKIKLSNGKSRSDAYVHRLVCEAYHGPCPHGMQCRHLDGNRHNNRPSNLCWADKRTNEADKVIHGTVTRGERYGAAVLTTEIVMTARARASVGERVDLIAAEFGVNPWTLRDAVTGRRWKHLPNAVPKLIKGAQRKDAEARARKLGLHEHQCQPTRSKTVDAAFAPLPAIEGDLPRDDGAT